MQPEGAQILACPSYLTGPCWHQSARLTTRLPLDTRGPGPAGPQVHTHQNTGWFRDPLQGLDGSKANMLDWLKLLQR